MSVAAAAAADQQSTGPEAHSPSSDPWRFFLTELEKCSVSGFCMMEQMVLAQSQECMWSVDCQAGLLVQMQLHV